MGNELGGTEFKQEELDELYKAVGFIVVQWGLAEQSLDCIVANLYQNLGGNSLRKRLPKMLTDKLKYVGECLSELPEIHTLKTEGESLVLKFKGFSSNRHNLIHGALGNLALEQGVFRFSKLDIDKEHDIHVVRDVFFDPKDFPEIAKYLTDLGNQAATFGHKLLEFADSPE